MKRRDFIKLGLASIPLIATPSFAGMLVRKISGGGGCDNVFQINTGTSSGSGQCGYWEDWLGTKFTASKTTTVCAASLFLEQYGDPSAYTVRASIYSDAPGSPNALIGSWSDNVNAAVGVSETEVLFSNIAANITASTVYWLILNISSQDSSNYVKWHYDSDYVSSGFLKSTSGNPGSWGSVVPRIAKYRLYE